MVRVHNELIDFIIKKASSTESKPRKRKALGLFKPLVNLVIGLSGREAFDINNHMVKSLKSTSLQPSATSDLWSSQRIYAKRLTGLMSKDEVIKKAAKAVVDDTLAKDWPRSKPAKRRRDEDEEVDEEAERSEAEEVLEELIPSQDPSSPVSEREPSPLDREPSPTGSTVSLSDMKKKKVRR